VGPFAFCLVAGAAVLHVTWNVVIKTAGDPLRASTVGMVAAAVVLVPAATVGWVAIGRPPIAAGAFGLGVVSGLLEAVYFALLSAAYRRGDLSVVYPVARGTAPLLAVAAGVVLLGERLGALGALGVVLLLGGLLAIQRPWRFLGIRRVRATGDAAPGHAADDQAAIGFAALTGVSIAAYSAVDRVGARLTEPWLYAAILFATAAFALVVVGRSLVARPGRPPEPTSGREWRHGIVGGLVSLAAYLLVLAAYTLAPLAAVAPLRESAIVVASAWGTWRLGEARGNAALRRVGAAVVVVAGAFLLALESSG